MKPRIGISTGPRPDDGRMFEAVDRAYVDAVVAAGGLPVLLPVLAADDADASLAIADGLLLTGGGDVDPARYGQAPVPEVYGVDAGRDTWELALVDAALRADLPVLGICRGCQVLAVATGGSLVQHVPALTGRDHFVLERQNDHAHDVRLTPGSAVARIVGAEDIGVNTLHHQAVDGVGTQLQVVGRSTDGVVEAVETPSQRVIGVQWHPEHLPDRPEHRALFEWLVEMAR